MTQHRGKVFYSSCRKIYHSIFPSFIRNKMNLYLKILGIREYNSSNFNSSAYWETRYQGGGTSGNGSYGRLAQFKAKVINDFVKENNIKKVIEFGCGDGNQLSFFEFNDYLGFDVSDTAINICKKKFKDDKTKRFMKMKDYHGEYADLVLSLDVIFHLVEDTVFEDYMQKVFVAAKRFVIIYSSNTSKMESLAQHVHHRRFTDWIEANKPEWSLKTILKNPYPYDGKDEEERSFSDFYIFTRTS